MKILENYPENLKKSSLILGFFDGVHLGHREVIMSAVNYAKKNNSISVLLTFKKSPSEYFGKKSELIYPRLYSYKLMEAIGVDYVIESDFEDLASITAKDYLENLINTFEPISISTGFNHTFGHKKEGNNEFLKSAEEKYGYKYFKIPPYKYEGEIVSSTLIKNLISSGNLAKANKTLGEPFTVSGEVVNGQKLGRKLGFPTANINYPEGIVRLPYGVYKGESLGHPAVINWGIKPTVSGKEECLEVHIIDFDKDLYGKILSVKIMDKIRSEQKFNSLENLKSQIKRDVESCLK